MNVVFGSFEVDVISDFCFGWDFGRFFVWGCNEEILFLVCFGVLRISGEGNVVLFVFILLIGCVCWFWYGFVLGGSEEVIELDEEIV